MAIPGTKVNGINAEASMTLNGRKFQVYTVAGCADLAEATAAIRTLQQFYTVEAIGTLASPASFRIVCSGGEDDRTPAADTGATAFGTDLGFTVAAFVL
jgi:hypothetical protein